MGGAMTTLRSVVGLVKRVPPLVRVGTACGVLAGLAIGMVVSAPVGILLGVSLGASVGIVAGIVMDLDEKRSSHRTRQLDEIIGVTSGSLGAPPSVPPPSDEDHERELRAWVTEWLTPPVPPVR
jgi:hypothetical protein